MAINKIQFQKGLSIAEFMVRYGTEKQCHDALVASRWPEGFMCPPLWRYASQPFRAQGAAILAMCLVPYTNNGHKRDHFSVHEIAVNLLDSGNAFADASEE